MVDIAGFSKHRYQVQPGNDKEAMEPITVEKDFASLRCH